MDLTIRTLGKLTLTCIREVTDSDLSWNTRSFLLFLIHFRNSRDSILRYDTTTSFLTLSKTQFIIIYLFGSEFSGLLTALLSKLQINNYTINEFKQSHDFTAGTRFVLLRNRALNPVSIWRMDLHISLNKLEFLHFIFC
jgi:hypothetical protein